MYCKFKDGDLVMVTRDTKSYYGACVRKWVYGTILTGFTADGRYDGYVRILLGKDNFTLIPIKDLKKISIKKIPKGSYSTPKFNNGDHVLYKGETGLLNIESWVIDNKPYYNECRIVIRTAAGHYIFVNECDTQMFNDGRYFDTGLMYRHLLNSTYSMTSREFEYCVNDVAVAMNLKKHEQKLKEANNMKNVNNMLDGRRFITLRKTGYREITATLYDSERTVDNSYINGPIMTETAKCHPEDAFDLDTGCKIALERLEKKWAKWKLINKKTNLQKFKDGEIWVKTDKENFIDFMAICARRDISWPNASALGWIPDGLINGHPIYVNVDPKTGYMFYWSYPSDSKSVITVPELTN